MRSELGLNERSIEARRIKVRLLTAYWPYPRIATFDMAIICPVKGGGVQLAVVESNRDLSIGCPCRLS